MANSVKQAVAEVATSGNHGGTQVAAEEERLVSRLASMALSAAEDNKDDKVVKRRLKPEDFELKRIIGRGAFGEVRVVEKKDTKEVFAMKTIRKSDMLKKNQVAHIRAERDVLALADNPWVVKLECSFQDDKNLYLVMEYLPGGDLMNILIKHDILTEAQTRFYIAETALAIHSVHQLNYIHRDLKPDNILIDESGHIKLTDFGLCKGFNDEPLPYVQQYQQESKRNVDLPVNDRELKPQHRKRQLAYTTVGTPDYIAPEVLGHDGYGQECDWWSLGVIMYECFYGRPPFRIKDDQDPIETCRRIVYWKRTFTIPQNSNVSAEAQDLIRKLMCDVKDRLTFEGIKKHPFFRGVDWENLRKANPPIVPKVTSKSCTSNFDEFQEQPAKAPSASEENASGAANPFLNYTYVRPKPSPSVLNLWSQPAV